MFIKLLTYPVHEISVPYSSSDTGALLIRNKAPENTREHLVWTVGHGDPMHEVCIPHSIPRARKQQEVGTD